MDLKVRPLTQPPVELVFHAVEDDALAAGARPGALSSAAPWMTLAAAVSMRLYVRNVSLEPTALAFVDVLVRMGVRVREEVECLRPGGWRGMLDVHPSPLRGINLPSQLIPKVRDEIPLLAVLAAFAQGTTTIRGASLATGENRDLCRMVCANLRALDAAVEDHADGFVIEGGRRLRGAAISTGRDPRIGMAMVIAGLAGHEECLVRDAETTLASQEVFFDRVFAAQFQRLAAHPPPANLAIDTRCCADAVRTLLPE